MTSQSKPPEPVGIKSLLELLNASEGLVNRDGPLRDASDSLTGAPPPVEQAAVPDAQIQTIAAHAERAAYIAGTPRPDQDIVADQSAIDDTADHENRFAAHVVRGMSKSKLR